LTVATEHKPVAGLGIGASSDLRPAGASGSTPGSDPAIDAARMTGSAAVMYTRWKSHTAAGGKY
jgi:hypothetical protein